jgi:hypothetical protein
MKEQRERARNEVRNEEGSWFQISSDVPTARLWTVTKCTLCFIQRPRG